MRIKLTALQIGMPAVAIFFIYWFVVRPWRADRTVRTDAMLLGAFLLTSVYDPLSNYFGIWLTQPYFVNRGASWTSSRAPHTASRGPPVAFPLILMPAIYLSYSWASRCSDAPGCGASRLDVRTGADRGSSPPSPG